MAQSDEDMESWKASLLRAGVYPVRTGDEDNSQVRREGEERRGRVGQGVIIVNYGNSSWCTF